jgi:hypothetical protein
METITHFGGNIGFANSNHGAINQGSMVTLAIGQANIITHIGNGAMLGVGIGDANIISSGSREC